MITPAQIKAARALLNWKQSDLAKASRLSLPSINNIERALGSPRVDTMNALQTALENAGILFTAGSGVALRDEVFEMLKFEGDDFIAKQNDDLFACMQGPDDEALMCGLDERMFVKHAPDQIGRYNSYHKKKNFKERILSRQNDTFFLTDPQVYRWIAPELIGTIPYLVYKDRLVMIMWDSKRTVIIRNPGIADTFRRQFEFLWKMATPIPPGHRSHIEEYITKERN